MDELRTLQRMFLREEQEPLPPDEQRKQQRRRRDAAAVKRFQQGQIKTTMDSVKQYVALRSE